MRDFEEERIFENGEANAGLVGRFECERRQQYIRQRKEYAYFAVMAAKHVPPFRISAISQNHCVNTRWASAFASRTSSASAVAGTIFQLLPGAAGRVFFSV